MTKLLISTLLLVSLLPSFNAAATSSSHPLRQSELLALVAGNALPENIVNEIRTRGVAFRMDSSFRAQLTAAGATSSIFAALDASKPPAQISADDKPDPALLQHLAAAGKLIRDKHYDEAADELAPTLRGNFENFEIGFVMGEILRQQDRWGEAAAVFAAVLREAPDFPDAHAHLSYALHRIGAFDESLREAKAELARTPQNAEAHRCAGIALGDFHKYDASNAEFREALRIKPDFALVHYDLGVNYSEQHDRENAIAEYRKTIALDPGYVNARYNLANELEEKGDLDSAIREYREAKRIDPNRFDVRMNLSNVLSNRGLYPMAIVELRELEAMAPDSAMCHRALANALYMVWDLKNAEKEYMKAAELDPSDATIPLGLGAVYEAQKHYDAALEQYRHAETLDENSPNVHRHLGRVHLAMSHVGEALKELKLAEQLAPGDSNIHDLYAQALQRSGDLDSAISEFKESLALDGKQTDVQLELAAALEKEGDWVASLQQHRLAALAEGGGGKSSIPPGIGRPQFGASKAYTDAQERFHTYLDSLKKAGKSDEANRLENAIRAWLTPTDTSEKLDELMQAGSQAFQERRFDDSERSYREAVQIAEKLPQPEVRLATALGHLGQLTLNKKDFAGAQAAFERQLQVTDQVYGPQNIAGTEPLKWLAFTATAQGDFATAQKFFDRALELNHKAYGENSIGYAEVLRAVAAVYIYQKAYDKAEVSLIKASDIEAKIYAHKEGNYGPMPYNNLDMLCNLYERWGQNEKMESCDRRLIAVVEKMNGPDPTSYIENLLTRDAKAMRAIGRPEEAAKIEARLKSLHPSADNNPN